MTPHDPVVTTEFVKSAAAELGTFVAAALGAFLVLAFNKLREWLKTRKDTPKAELLPKLVEKDLEVYQLLSELLLKSDAGRAFVMQFHNGTYYMNSVSQMKMTCTHEVVSPGVSRQQLNRQNLLVSQYTKDINDIISQPSCFIEVSDSSIGQWSQLLRSSGTKLGAYAVLKDGQAIEGYLGLSFIDDLQDVFKNTFPNLSKEDAEKKLGLLLESYAIRIGYLLRKGPY
jgi:hypothetical protein